MNVVILGSGRTGVRLATAMQNDGHIVTVIDIDSDKTEVLASRQQPVDETDGKPAITILKGDGTKDSLLEAARIREADFFAALTNDDNSNGLAALKARNTYQVMTVVAAIRSEDLGNVFESLGVACINPSALAVESVLKNVPQVMRQEPASPTGD